MRQILKGATDQSVVIRIIDDADGTPETGVEHNTTGIDLWYRREGATKTSITEAALSALNDAHSDGGIEHIDDGYYRLDLPDAAFATGANGVMIGGHVDDMVVIGCYVHLVDYNPQDAVRLGLTALPNAAADAAGGLPISDAGGLDLDAKIGSLTFTVAGSVDANVTELAGEVVSAGVIDANLVQIDGTDITGGDNTGANWKTFYENANNASSILLDDLVGSSPSAIADAVWDESTTGHTTSGTFGEQLKTDVDAILADTNELQTDWANGGRLDNILDARASQTSVDDVPTNSELATALAAADDAVLAAIAALNNVSTAAVASAVWSAGTRVLTAGTNIALAKGTGVTGFNDITAAAVLAAGDIDGYALESALKLILAAAAGEVSGANSTEVVVRAADDSKDRITATVDQYGNRSALTLDATG